MALGTTLQLPVKGTPDYDRLEQDLLDDVGCTLEGANFYLTPPGAVAAKDLERGQGVLADRAICYVDHELSYTEADIASVKHCVANLPVGSLRRLNTLHEGDVLSYSSAKLFGLLNYLTLSTPFPIMEDRREDALSKIITAKNYPPLFCGPLLSWTPCLFARSCKPNATIVPSIQRFGQWDFTVVAITPIEKGEQIFLDYASTAVDKLQHQAPEEWRGHDVLQHEVFCALCVDGRPSLHISQSLRNRHRIQALIDHIGDGTELTPTSTLSHAREILNLCYIEKLVDMKVCGAYCAASIAMGRDGDTLRQHEMAYWAYVFGAQMLGREHPLMKTCKYFDLEDSWGSDAEYEWDKIRRRLESAEPDFREPDWLWHKEETVSDLRSDVFFPSFHELPRADLPELSFFGSSESPNRHWVFLAEIDGREKYKGETALCHDKNGLPFEMSMAGIRSGKIRIMASGTVVLFPYRMIEPLDSSEGNLGIRPLSPSRYEVLPVASIEQLLELSDKVNNFSKAVGQRDRRCFGCSEVGETHLPCEDCGRFWFCTVECYDANLENGKRHEDDCKLLQHRRIRQLFFRDWAIFTGPVDGRGPLPAR